MSSLYVLGMFLRNLQVVSRLFGIETHNTKVALTSDNKMPSPLQPPPFKLHQEFMLGHCEDKMIKTLSPSIIMHFRIKSVSIKINKLVQKFQLKWAIRVIL